MVRAMCRKNDSFLRHIALEYYNNERTHQGKICWGQTPMETLIDGKSIWKQKFIHQDAI